MEMKATHKLVDLRCGDEWLLKCTGSEHWWCKTKGELADMVWRGPASFPVSYYKQDKHFELIVINKYKGDK